MPIDPADKFLTVGEIAALLKLNQQTVRNWIDRGELIAVRVGPRRVRVRRVDLDAFLEAGTTVVTSEGTAEDEAADTPPSDARAVLTDALADAQQAATGNDDAALVKAMRALAAAATELANAIER